ncbi:hypothetical protein [Thermocrispum municipale]|uniref:hypothetical protein n=1 Tax=Thermocrispum municipale TaxID=37926 RepID=UPI001FDFF714|nr:hypothetical protein [Thermocrispum municipale]
MGYFDVSRGSLREALRLLSFLGAIDVRSGPGGGPRIAVQSSPSGRASWRPCGPEDFGAGPGFVFGAGLPVGRVRRTPGSGRTYCPFAVVCALAYGLDEPLPPLELPPPLPPRPPPEGRGFGLLPRPPPPSRPKVL